MFGKKTAKLENEIDNLKKRNSILENQLKANNSVKICISQPYPKFFTFDFHAIEIKDLFLHIHFDEKIIFTVALKDISFIEYSYKN